MTVTVLSPGLMDTGFDAASGFTTPASLKHMEMLPADVARIGLNALFAGKSGVIAGRLNKVMALAGRVFSRHFAVKSQYDMAIRQDSRNGVIEPNMAAGELAAFKAGQMLYSPHQPIDSTRHSRSNRAGGCRC